MEAKFRDRVDKILTDRSTLSLATAGFQGEPCLADLFFCSDPSLKAYFVSSPDSRHAQNLATDPRASISVHVDTWDWREIAGLQMEGAVEMLEQADPQARAWRLYKAKFPFVEDFADEIARSRWYCFTPRWIRIIDNRLGFGHREEYRI